jgi:hypothetical protein
MNWTKASAAAEILSSVAILVTLVYLAVEIQQNVAATQADTRQAMLESDQQFIQLFIDSPELHFLWYKPELTDEEKVRLSYYLVTFMRMRESNWFQYESGTLDDRTWRSYRASIVAVLSAPRTRLWWEKFGVERVFDPDFVSVVDNLIVNQALFDRSYHVAVFD